VTRFTLLAPCFLRGSGGDATVMLFGIKVPRSSACWRQLVRSGMPSPTFGVASVRPILWNGRPGSAELRQLGGGRSRARTADLLLVRQCRIHLGFHIGPYFPQPYTNSGDLLSLRVEPVSEDKIGLLEQFWYTEAESGQGLIRIGGW